MRLRLALCFGLAALAGCRLSIDPDEGRYSCEAPDDCGDGYECRPQAAGGGRCYRLGDCADVETCNGQDDDCDGRVDESFAGEGDACTTGRPGRCAPGALACVDGGVACVGLEAPVAETCNGQDDDCDGQADEDFDLASDDAHCGACGRACAPGASCALGRCAETDCGDGADNDSDGLADCDDPDCFAQPCGATGWRCGLLPDDDGLDDGGSGDAGFDDGGFDGGGFSDAGVVDGGFGDAGFDGGGFADAGVIDGGPGDAGFVDGGPGDGGLGDGGLDGGGAPLVPGCFPPEAECANGVDDDGDGLVDCADPDCDGRTCFSGTQCIDGACPGPG